MDFDKLLKLAKPHVFAILIMVGLSFAYCYPILQGKKIVQGDIVQYKGMSNEIDTYRDKTGQEPLWTGNLFSGMPSFLISTRFPNNWTRYISKLFMLGLPNTINLIFICLLCFYVLLQTLRLDRWISLMGSVAFAFSTFFIVSLEAGHTSKIHAIAYMAPALAGIILAYRKKYLLGGALTALALSLQINANHFQITFYLMFIVLIILITELIKALKEKVLPHYVKASSILALAAILAVVPNFSKLYSTYEHSKETIRGGKSELSSVDKSSTGLDKGYAMRWSQAPVEMFSLLAPRAVGGSSHEEVGENSKLYQGLIKKGVPKQNAKSIVKGAPTYWGPKPFTSGPHYFGIITLFLFVFALFTVKNSIKWWVITGVILSVLLSFGRHFQSFTGLFFDYFPMYNKFRTPEMTLVIAAILVPLFALLGLQKIYQQEISKEELKKYLKYTLYIFGGTLVLMLIGGSSIFSFVGEQDARLAQSGWPVDLLEKQRAYMMRVDVIRSMVLIVLSAGLFWFYYDGKLKKNILLIGLGAIVLFDLWGVDRRYLNQDNFVEEKNYENRFVPSEVDLAILQDQDPNYRVFNLTTDYWNDAMTSYHHKSVGGYHAAKLIRYQDLYDYYLNRNVIGKMTPQQLIQHPVLNMLNTKYLILSGKNGKPQPIKNPNALGNAWFVKDIQWAKNADEEIKALASLQPKSKVVIDERYKDYMTDFSMDSTPAKISFVDYKPSHLMYETSSQKEQFAVFSEVYYNEGKGWNAYVDGKYLPHIRVNYVLRGMKIPAGEHTIEFKFEPKPYLVGEKISLAGSILLLISTCFVFFQELRKLVGKREVIDTVEENV